MLRKDSTPKLECYCYKNKSVKFDSPFLLHNKEQTDDSINIYVTTSNLQNTNDQSDLQSLKKIHNLPDSEPEPNPSKRDTYLVNDSTLLLVNQPPAAALRPFILKGSKSAKPNRSRSSCEMVQFAHLPNTEDKISQITDFQSKGLEINIAYSPMPNLDVWSQMMDNFNESVKKEYFSANDDGKDVNICTVRKVLFNSKSINTHPTLQVTSPEEILPNDDVNIEINKSETKRKNTVHCSLVSSCLPNNAIKIPCDRETRQSTRNNDNLSKRTNRQHANIKKKLITSKTKVFDVPSNMPVSQPNSKGTKCNFATKSASTEISTVTNSPQNQTLSNKRCTRNKSKLTASQITDNSLAETAIKRVTRAKQQGLSSEDCCDSVPSARKITRQQANIKENKDKNLNAPITGKKQRTVRFAKYVDIQMISPIPKKTK